MPDIYDQLLDQPATAGNTTSSPAAAPQAAPVESGSTPPVKDIYDQLLDKVQTGTDKALDVVLDQASKVEPDRAARIAELAKSSGLPADMVERNFDAVQQRDKALKMRSVLASSPVLQAQMLQPGFAKLARDDIENLSGVEKTIGFLRNAGSALVSGAYNASASITGVAQGGAGLLSQFVTGPLNGTLLPQDIGAVMERGLGQTRQGIEATQKQWAPKSSAILDSGWYSGLQSLSQNLITLPLAVLTGNPMAALIPMVGMVGGSAYGQARDKGLGVVPSVTFGASQAAIEYATEKLPVGWLVKDLKAGTPFYKMLTRQMAAEIPGEQVATVLQDLNEWAVLNPEKSFSSYLAERPSAAAQTLIATVVGTGGQVSIMKGVEAAVGRASGQDAQAQQSEHGAQILEQLNKLAAASKLQTLDAASFAQFVEQASEEGPVHDVYIDGQTLMQSGVAEKLAEVSPSIAAQYEHAVQTGGSVRIPVSEYAATIAPTEYAQGLLDHLKIDPAGMSRVEAQEYLQTSAQQMQQEIEAALAGQQVDSTFRASVDTVRENIKAQLGTANRFTPQVNDAYATLVGEFYANAATRSGMTPEQMFERYPLQVQAQNVAGQQFDQSAKPRTPEFREWFGRSKAKGVVYHATAKDFDAFNTGLGDLGAHFGTEGQANQIAGGMRLSNQEGTQIMPVWLSLQNPLRLKDVGTFHADGIAVQMEKKGLLPKGEGKRIEKEIGKDWKLRKKYDPMLRQIIKEAGYDGVVYANTQEGAGDSYIAFDPTQIKSAIGNSGAFDATDPNILNQGARGAFNPATNTISLLKAADLSTFLHESGHFFLEVQMDMAAKLAGEAAGFTLTEGEQQIVADANALLQWFGVQDFATWYNLDFEEKRSYHEKFARGFEAYLFEGNAPSIEVQGLFQRFRAWMVNVYKELKALNVEMTAEVRGVMDRMLATDEQIKAAQQARSMLPLFESAQQAGMTSEDFAAYQGIGQTATADAQDQLTERGLRDMQWLANAKGRELKRLQKAAEAIRAQVRVDARREIMSQPVYRAWQFLTGKEQDGGPPVGKLDRNALAEIYGGRAEEGFDRYATLDWKRLTDQHMTSDGGLHPDMVAEQFEFTSGDELVRTLIAAESPKIEIEALTDLRMLEQHGDLATPEALSRAADKAIHNEVRARVIATELKALNDAIGPRAVTGTDKNGRKITTALLPQAARQFADTMISRLKIRNLRPGQYAAAEARAAKAAEKAFKQANLEQAAAEKRNQLVNNFAAKAAYATMDEVESIVRYINKFDSEGTRSNLDTGYLEQIDALREKYDLRKRSNKDADRTASLRTWVQSRLNAGEIPDIAESLLTPQERAAYLAQVQSRDEDGDLVYADDEDQIKLLAESIDRSAKRPFKDLTVEEFRGLRDTIKSIEHLARLKNKLLTARENQEYEAVRDEIAGGIVANAKNSGKNTRTANDWLGQKLQAIKHFGASHIKVATWARIMDGGQDNGPVWNYIVRPANERASQETAMRSQATEALDAIMRPILANVPMADKVGKGKYFASIHDSLNWQERFAIALNLGNESNMQRLMDGKGWTMQQLKPVLDTLTAAEWQAAQAVWDHFESYRPQIAEKEIRVSGKEPEWIPARPITVNTADGKTITLPGGYYPVVFDPRVNLKASQHSSAEEAKNLLKSAYSAATTRRSFVKTRVEEVKGRPLLLNLQGLYSGVNDVIHDLAWHEWVIDANKLLRSKSIDTAIREHYGPEVKREFEKWRDDIVAGSRRLDHAIERAAGWARQSVSASALTFNIVSAAMQPLGLSNSIVRIGAQWVGKGLARYVASPIEATNEAKEKSSWMSNRTRTRFRELNELRNQVQGQTTAKELMGRYGYWMMMQAQMMVDVPTWWGAYEKGIAGGHGEDTAVALADQAVKDSQGGGEEVDQSGVERGNALVKLFTAFYGFMGTTLNAGYLDAKTESSKAKRAVNALLLYSVPAVMGMLLKDALTPRGGGDGDPEKLLKKLLSEQLSFLLGMVTFGREFDQAGKALLGEDGGRGYSGPSGLRMIGDAYKMAQQARQGEFDKGFRSAFVNLLGDLTGLPSVQINRTITGAQALADGQTSNPTAIVFGFKKQ